MKTETLYICEYCGEKYQTEAECQACEQSHAIPTYINEKRYSKGFKYPDTLCVEFDNDHYIIYKYLKPVLRKENDSNDVHNGGNIQF